MTDRDSPPSPEALEALEATEEKLDDLDTSGSRDEFLREVGELARPLQPVGIDWYLAELQPQLAKVDRETTARVGETLGRYRAAKEKYSEGKFGLAHRILGEVETSDDGEIFGQVGLKPEKSACRIATAFDRGDVKGALELSLEYSSHGTLDSIENEFFYTCAWFCRAMSSGVARSHEEPPVERSLRRAARVVPDLRKLALDQTAGYLQRELGRSLVGKNIREGEKRGGRVGWATPEDVREHLDELEFLLETEASPREILMEAARFAEAALKRILEWLVPLGPEDAGVGTPEPRASLGVLLQTAFALDDAIQRRDREAGVEREPLFPAAVRNAAEKVRDWRNAAAHSSDREIPQEVADDIRTVSAHLSGLVPTLARVVGKREGHMVVHLDTAAVASRYVLDTPVLLREDSPVLLDPALPSGRSRRWSPAMVIAPGEDPERPWESARVLAGDIDSVRDSIGRRDPRVYSFPEVHSGDPRGDLPLRDRVRISRFDEDLMKRAASWFTRGSRGVRWNQDLSSVVEEDIAAGYLAWREHALLDEPESLEDLDDVLGDWLQGWERVFQPHGKWLRTKLAGMFLPHDWATGAERAATEEFGSLPSIQAFSGMRESWETLERALQSRGCEYSDDVKFEKICRQHESPGPGHLLAAAVILGPRPFIHGVIEHAGWLMEKRLDHVLTVWFLTRLFSDREADPLSVRRELEEAIDRLPHAVQDAAKSHADLVGLLAASHHPDVRESDLREYIDGVDEVALLRLAYDGAHGGAFSLKPMLRVLLPVAAEEHAEGLAKEGVVSTLSELIAGGEDTGFRKGVSRSIRHHVYGDPRNPEE